MSFLGVDCARTGRCGSPARSGGSCPGAPGRGSTADCAGCCSWAGACAAPSGSCVPSRWSTKAAVSIWAGRLLRMQRWRRPEWRRGPRVARLRLRSSSPGSDSTRTQFAVGEKVWTVAKSACYTARKGFKMCLWRIGRQRKANRSKGNIENV